MALIESYYTDPIPPTFIRDQARPWEAEAVGNWIRGLDTPANPKFLEIGAGKGVVINRLAQTGIDAVGIDIRNVFNGNGSFVKADGRNMPFSDDSFDIVFEHLAFDEIGWFSDTCVEDITGILRETKRVLRPGGFFISKYFGSLASFSATLSELNFKLVASENSMQHFSWKNL